MLVNLRYLVSDLLHWASLHRLAVAAAAAVVIAASAAAYLLLDGRGDDGGAAAPAPDVVVGEVTAPAEREDEIEAEDLGFPAFATKNTTRVSGPDSIADAAGVALAVFPSTGGVPGPDAVSFVDAREWQAGIAAASLAAEPVRAPTLLTESGEVPELTENAFRALDPAGSSETGGREAFVIGAAARPEGADALAVRGANAAELAAEIDRLRQELAGDPAHVLVTTSDEPAYAMPAAAWAARSGDPVLFVQRRSVPAATRQALGRHEGTPVYVLGPESAISSRTMDEVRELARGAERIAVDGPTESAIAFARYVDGSFGWNINDPGHGLVIANVRRPLDAAAAAPLSGSGTWGPLLVTDEAAAVPAALRGYLLDLKPGYEDDPTRAVYNHVWLIGDPAAISVGFQAQVDELAEAAPVTSGSGGGLLTPPRDGDQDD